MILSLKKADALGVISSSLCLLHCLATPLLFAVQTQMVNIGNPKPFWWSGLDILFLIISFFAIYKAIKTTTNSWIKISLWGSWFLLTTIIINEKLMWFAIPEYLIYFPALGLICFHIYNSKYCQCEKDGCCVNKV